MSIDRDFLNWMLNEKHLSKGVAKTNFSRILRIDNIYDIFSEYIKDGCVRLMSLFVYSKQDLALGLKPSHDVIICGDYYNGTQSLKYALKLYIEYLNDIDFLLTARAKAGLSAEKTTKKSLSSMTDEEFDTLINDTQRLIEQVYEFCEDASECEMPDIDSSANPNLFVGSFKAFLRFVGPFCKNYVNSITKKERSKHKGICEYCKKKAELQSAHKDGEDRPIIIKAILEAHFKKAEDYYEVDLSVFEKMFKDAHLPVEDHIFFLCDECHGIYDRGSGITTTDILLKRKNTTNPEG